MKKSIFVCVVLVLMAFVLVSCKREAQASSTPVAANNEVAESATSTVEEVPEKEADDISRALSMPSHEGMVELRGNDVALEFDDVRLTRDELLILLQQLNAIPSQNETLAAVSARVNGLTSVQQQAVRRVLYALVRQQLLLRAARASGTVFTEADRQRFAELWRSQNPDGDFAEYLSQLPLKATTPLTISRDDQMVLYAWSECQVRDLAVPEELVQQALSQIRQIEQAFGQQVETDRKEFEELADNADLYTDEGFAKLAAEYSDGVEADNGGVLGELLTRSEIAAANFDQPFTTPVGETSSLIETPTSLRYIRVLEEIPGTMPGEPPKLKVAQILYGKRALDDLPSEALIRQNLLYTLQNNYFNELVRGKLAEQFHFRCPLLPDLLDEKKLEQNALDPESAEIPNATDIDE
ncbi:MAG: peptidylprolyl isomerase [Victivallales bacterium]|nr:peptidylprolyl isomerase [Victivallales bacterium]